MAANPPYEGAVLVLGTADEVGIPLLEKADDPNDVVAYAGYGYWAPAALVRKVKGLSKVDVEVGPVAPVLGEQAAEVPASDAEAAPEIPVTPTENDPTAEAVAPAAPSKAE